MATTTQTVPTSDRLRRLPLHQRLLARPAAGSIIITVFVWLVFAVLGGTTFVFSGPANYLDVAAQVGIVATSVALLMIAGEFDLSVGSMVGFAGIIIGICATVYGLPIWLSIVISLVLTTALGAINGIIVVRTGLPSFIVTLATLFIIAGLSSVLTSLVTNITYIPIAPQLIAADPLAALFNWKLSFVLDGQTTDFQASIVWWVVIAGIGAYVLGRRKFGNWIAGVGGSPIAARNLGVPVARVKITLFATTALSAAILAAIQSTRFSSADILRGTGYELTAITTAVIGGCLLTGGYGSVAGTALGALTLGMAQIGIVYASINADWNKIATGALLLTAVVLNNWIRRRFAGLR